MFPLALVHTKSHELKLPYLLIGGHAVNTYAEPRATLDVDFLIRQEDEPHWRRMILAEGFRLHRDGGNFVQFSPPYGVNWAHLGSTTVRSSAFTRLRRLRQAGRLKAELQTHFVRSLGGTSKMRPRELAAGFYARQRGDV